ncbi:VOC family protein [Maribacter sp.]|nr:VOC family protein [Maribacter sp.]
MSLEYKRNTLVVADYERSLRIYRDILGFSVNYIKRSASDSYSYPVFNIPPEGEATFIALDSPSQERTFALTEVKGISLPKQTGPRMSVSVIKIKDLKRAILKIEALGLETLDLITDRTDDLTYIEQAFIDFDGHLILLYQLIEKNYRKPFIDEGV